jgi:serine/threonine protein kinase
VDERSDIWAFGCVLYEMLGGRRAFAHTTIAETVAAILEREPDWSALPAGTPAGIGRLLRRCLEKEPRRRWHSAADVRLVLEDAAAGGEAGARDGARSRGSRVAVVSWLVAAVAIAGATLATLSAVRRTAPAASPLVLDVNTPPTADPTSFALSPDGRVLVYVGLDQGTPVLWLRRLGLPAPPEFRAPRGRHSRSGRRTGARSASSRTGC